MATKINDISTNLLTNALNTMKESKTRKAEAAFQSFLNNAVTGNASQDKLEGLQNLAVDSGKTDYSKDKDFSEVEVKEVSDTKPLEKDEVETVDSVSVEDETELTDMEKADKVLGEVCEEMGISREELLAQFEELMDSIAAILMEKFGVTEEDLYRVLETLGLSMTDLFNQTDLMNVVVELTGVQDIAAVLTDENLYGQIQEVVSELTQLKENTLLGQSLDAEQLQVLEKSVETVMNVETADDSKLVMNKDTVLDAGADVDDAAATKQEPVLEIVSDKQNENNMNHQEQQMTGNEAFQQFTGRVAQYAEQVMAANGNEFAQQADMEAIIRQVTDYVKLQVNAQTTSLEMQLHPDSYGKLNLQVSVRDGVVTAKLAVENEMVRQALETQIVQLREDMSEKGLKVDAVEVAIASHEFERNLEEGQENSERSSEDADTARRQINLREEGMSLEELTAMSEAEALTRKIMLENGNSIDFSA